MSPDHRAIIRNVLLLTLALNLLVMGLKIIVSWWTGSLSLMADALHSLTDSAGNILGLVTTRLASPQPDRDHPYGHLKFEAIGALGIAAFLGVACFEILQGAVERLLHSEKAVQISGVELWIVVMVLGINIFVTYYERRVGIETGSAVLVADAHHTMSDIWVTIGVLVGLVGIWLWNWQWLDAAIAFPVAVMVFWSGWSVLRQNVPVLVDEAAIAPEVIHAIALQVSGVINCHDIASRGIVGRQVFIEMHLIVGTADVEAAHQITEAIESILEDRFGPARVLIHVEPPTYHSDRISYEATD
ncbi:cation transporter [Neosynechococcus sphagnicola sy1]|uniref:Cation transporter n=1 Tax=Neosynechococcus sphagnicola sy1 TaxID=1497020 RepID=A0A098TM14_9CYAN|nr:cation diffusion facilitator family transporter [Neosynechococcus sphagnicola]KGF72907.1 cation transporter [Neosynechococcus sphagnicola sy1]